MTPTWEAELGVLGRMLNFPDLARHGLAVLETADFAAPEHRHLFDAMRAVLMEGGTYLPSEVGKRLMPCELSTLAHAMELGIDAGPARAQNFAAFVHLLTEQRVVRDAKSIGASLVDNPGANAVAK